MKTFKFEIGEILEDMTTGNLVEVVGHEHLSEMWNRDWYDIVLYWAKNGDKTSGNYEDGRWEDELRQVLVEPAITAPAPTPQVEYVDSGEFDEDGDRVYIKAETTPPQTGASKNDSGKPQLSLIPREALLEMAAGFAYGANKYGRFNFEKGHKFSRLIDAALRHLSAVAAGEFIDSESGNSHLSHALCSLAMLAYNWQHHPENNDLDR